MRSISQILHVPLQYAAEWRRNVVRRNGLEDARRAQEARLLSQQAGPPIGAHLSVYAHQERQQGSRLT